MELPEDYQKKFHSDPTAKKPRNQWEEQIANFASRLNPDRIRAGYKPYTEARIGRLLNNAGVHNARDAYRFYQRIETQARHFGKLFDHLARNRFS